MDSIGFFTSFAIVAGSIFGIYLIAFTLMIPFYIRRIRSEVIKGNQLLIEIRDQKYLKGK